MLIVIVTEREEKRAESREQKEENESENEGREKEGRTREREKREGEREGPPCSGSSRLRVYIQKASVCTGKMPACVQHGGVLPIHTETT